MKKTIRSDTNEVKQAINTKSVVQMKPEDAVALKVQCELSDNQYQMIRNSSKVHNADIYPSLHQKKSCYPKELEITKTSAKCSLKNMVQHSLNRVIKVCQEDMGKIANSKTLSGIFYLKGGFDGASSQSVYKQGYEDTDLQTAIQNEKSLFQTALVPLKLVFGETDVWVNVKPNSSHFCRLLHLQYRKETQELSKEGYKDIIDQMDSLEDFKIYVQIESSEVTIELKIKAKIDLTMFDGKVVNALPNTLSSQSCNICGAKPTEMNDLDKLATKVVNEDACALGL